MWDRFPWRRLQGEWTNGFCGSSERHRQRDNEVNKSVLTIENGGRGNRNRRKLTEEKEVGKKEKEKEEL